jgi:hypothetical protein
VVVGKTTAAGGLLVHATPVVSTVPLSPAPPDGDVGVLALAVADFNGDSFPDILTLGNRSLDVTVLDFVPSYWSPDTGLTWGAAAGGARWQIKQVNVLPDGGYVRGGAVFALLCGDLDGDGDLDVVVAGRRNTDLAVYVVMGFARTASSTPTCHARHAHLRGPHDVVLSHALSATGL